MPDFTGKRVVVIGGGNVAMDVTRSSIRLGANKVTCVYRRRQEDMTAQPEEVEGAMAEGAEMPTLMAPSHIEADEDGCRRPVGPAPDHRRGRQGRASPSQYRRCGAGSHSGGSHRGGHRTGGRDRRASIRPASPSSGAGVCGGPVRHPVGGHGGRDSPAATALPALLRSSVPLQQARPLPTTSTNILASAMRSGQMWRSPAPRLNGYSPPRGRVNSKERDARRAQARFPVHGMFHDG